MKEEELNNENVVLDEDAMFDVDDDDSAVDEFETKHLSESERLMIKKYCKK